MWTVYKLTFPNGMIYVGQTSKNPRYRAYHCKRIRECVDKYGMKNVCIDVLELCETQEDAWEREIYWIKKFDSTNPLIGLNSSTGGKYPGSGVKPTEEAIERIRNLNKGKRLTEEEKK